MEQYGMKFEEMNTKQKIGHIWEYYRYHILATIIAVCVVIGLGKSILFQDPPNDVDIMLAGQMHLDVNYSDVTAQFKEDYKTGLTLTNVNWEEDPQTASIIYQKIPLLISTEELDVIGIATDTFEGFAQIYGEEVFTPLEDIPELSGLLEKYKDHLYVCDKMVDENGDLVDTEPHVYGIKVDTFNNIPCIIASEEMVIGINSKAKDLEKSLSMLEYIIE